MSNAVDLTQTGIKIAEILYKMQKGDTLLVECMATGPNHIMNMTLNPQSGSTKKWWRWPPK